MMGSPAVFSWSEFLPGKSGEVIEIKVKEWQAAGDVEVENFKSQVGPLSVSAEVHKNPVQTIADHVWDNKGERQVLQRH